MSEIFLFGVESEGGFGIGFTSRFDLIAQSSSVSAASYLPWRRYSAPRFFNVVVTVGESTLAALCQPPYSPYGVFSRFRCLFSSRSSATFGHFSIDWQDGFSFRLDYFYCYRQIKHSNYNSYWLSKQNFDFFFQKLNRLKCFFWRN